MKNPLKDIFLFTLALALLPGGLVAQSPKSPPKAPAVDYKLSDDEYKSLEPLAIQLNAKQQQFQQAITKLYEFDTSDESRAGFALNAINNLQKARDLMSAADKALSDAIRPLAAKRDCEKCPLDWPSKTFKPPGEAK